MFEQRNSEQSWFASTKAKKMKSHRCRAIGPRDCKQRERSTYASALRFLALLAHSPRFGAHKERPEDNATTQLTRRQSPQLAVGHEDDITCFTIVPWILYAPLRPLPMLFDVCFAFPFDFFSLSLFQHSTVLLDIRICRCRVMKYPRRLSLLFFYRCPCPLLRNFVFLF